MLAFSRRLGLDESDAQDATQETFLAFTKAHQEAQYDQERGRLRSWLFGVAQRKVRDIQRRHHRQEAILATDESNALDEAVGEDPCKQIWEEEWRRAIIKQCLDLVRRDVAPKTFAAFEEITLQQHSVAETAKRVGMSEAAAARANQRVLSRMRDLHQILDVDW